MGRLGKTIDTLNYRNGTKYGLYDSNLDFFFRVIKSVDVPFFQNNASNVVAINSIYQQIILPTSGSKTILMEYIDINDLFILTLNGLTLIKDYDYTTSGNVITLNSEMVSTDTITIIYTNGSGSKIVGTTIDVTSSVPSGTTGNEGSNKYYFNTTTGKYEIYADTTPVSGSNIIVMINGATLANGVDYYQSTTNAKRIILEGDILVGDIILITYIPNNNTINGLNTNKPIVTWGILNPPQLANGFFSLEVSTGTSFSTFYSSGLTSYSVGNTSYSDSFTASGTIGTTLYYRVKNQKDFVTLCGDIVSNVAYSEIIPIIIQTNSINSY